MNEQQKGVIEYWKQSLFDARRICPKVERDNHITISKDEVYNGKLLEESFQELVGFVGKKKEFSGVDILLCLTSIKKNNKKAIGLFWSYVYVSPEGELTPPENREAPWFSRDCLEPNEKEDYTVGTLDDVTAFCNTNDYKNSEITEWAKWLEYADTFFSEVIGKPLLPILREEKGSEKITEDIFIQKDLTVLIEVPVNYATRQIEWVYQDFLKGKHNKPLPLFQSYASTSPPPLRKMLSDTETLNASSEHLGQMNDTFPLSETQRSVMHHFQKVEEGEILAVNGPPGTGKTTLLQNIVAKMWVDAAVKGKEPPLIVATSSNNQAITNIIDSFGKVGNNSQSELDEEFIKRWIPDLTSYGLFLCANNQYEESHKKYLCFKENKDGQTGFPVDAEKEDFVKKAEEQYLHNFKKFQKTTAQFSIKEAVKTLHETLLSEKKTIEKIINFVAGTINNYERLTSRYSELHGHFENISKIIEKIKRAIEKSEKKANDLKTIKRKWKEHKDKEPWWLTLLSGFFVSFKRRRHDRNRDFLVENNLSDNLTNLDTEQISQEIIQLIETEENNRVGLSSEYKLLEEEQENIEKNRKYWAELRSELQIKEDDAPFPDNQTNFDKKGWKAFLNALDTSSRFYCFLLASHYWEGRWLIEITENKQTKAGQKHWRRYAKLTPCFVATFFKVPSFFQSNGTPSYNEIDLLIVDEAGQACSEIGGASFALAKKALVVGDTLQIEPIWNIPPYIDEANVKKYINKELTGSKESGIMASSGSVMVRAQQQSPYHQIEGMSRGLFLLEHRRCYDEIIAYCNEAIYEGNLQPLRGPCPKEGNLFPPFGYMSIEGESFGKGSKSNTKEAETIVHWIEENQQSLKERYREKELKDIVAVITPFSRQKELIKKELKAKKIENITVGTVHALQGAERPIVIFSPVYGINIKHMPFIEGNRNMLNVAVSRAQDSFLLFGDIKLFEASSCKHIKVLADHLYSGGALTPIMDRA